MFNFGKKSSKEESLGRKLNKTRRSLLSGLKDFLGGRKTLDAEVLTELETRLLMADVGLETTEVILDGLKSRLNSNMSESEILTALSAQMLKVLKPVEQKLCAVIDDSPYVILLVGVNGVGKTTTIGKLARKLQDQGKSVILAAGDTFRAAAVEQLKTWGERNNIAVVAQEIGSDSASVIYDAISSAQAKKVDVLLADTAGRLHTQSNLMEELKKIKRVMQKHNRSFPHETILVLDAGVGQNALVQAEEFHAAIGVDSLILTKMDGTAKGGILLALAEKLRIPIKYIGVGETMDDLRDFDADKFVKAITTGE